MSRIEARRKIEVVGSLASLRLPLSQARRPFGRERLMICARMQGRISATPVIVEVSSKRYLPNSVASIRMRGMNDGLHQQA